MGVADADSVKYAAPSATTMLAASRSLNPLKASTNLAADGTTTLVRAEVAAVAPAVELISLALLIISQVAEAVSTSDSHELLRAAQQTNQ